MRGKILQYNGSDGSGIVVVEGQQHKFTIATWKGDVAPAVGKTVDVVLAGDAVQSVTLVGDDVLLREKTAELTGKLGGLVGGLAKGGSGGTGGSILARYGKPLLIAYGVFVIGSLFFNFISMEMFGMKQGKPLFDLGSQLSQAGGGGGVKLLVLLGYLSIAVPLFWPDKRAWLLLLLPLLSVLWGFWSVRRAMGPMAELFSYGIGFYLTIAAALYIAATAFKRFRTG
ncbi:MAG TPA: hypothetical protein VGQ69_07850 [Gemmatimonadales bacterium]|jgi:hypothetical protein|nr:hypothetical protein [Gemmatimonadales bacterium]